MNRKEINAMTDEELCGKAAELSGWKPPTGEFDYVPDYSMEYDIGGMRYYRIHKAWIEREITPSEFESFYFWHTDDGRSRTDAPSDYLNNMEDAWWLIDFLADIGDRHIMVRFDALRTDDENNPNWTIHISPDIRFDVDRKDVPRAITKAFIMAMESE